jgi:hypothetical protein
MTCVSHPPVPVRLNFEEFWGLGTGKKNRKLCEEKKEIPDEKSSKTKGHILLN